MRKLVVILSCIVLCPFLLIAQDRDAHFDTPQIAPIAHRSTFVHGYLHGYEEGFHQGDFDLQMGRVGRGDYGEKCAIKGYHREFGPKSMYASGFQQGFSVGYADAATGRSFRAVENVVGATAAATVSGNSESEGFDRGMMFGYVAGQHQGLDDARRELQAQPAPACPVRNGSSEPEFCAAYAQGFQIGYSDGFVNQAKTTLAKK